MPTPLSIVGVSARAAAQSAARAGYDVCAVDLFADRDTQQIA
jgi:predicted ATP-grasp superfamily ATP-dependent carboligase